MNFHHLRSRHALLVSLSAAALTILIQGVWGTITSAAGGPLQPVIFREDFNTLDRWKPLKFRSIDNLSVYTLDMQANKECYVKAKSSSSASAMIWDGEFDVYDYPMIRWR